MEDLNDIYFFASVVRYGGFSAAARTIGVEKTRLSRRIAALERRLGVRLLQRTTRALALTEAGQRFFERCVATVEGAQAAYDSVAELREEPAGLVRLSSPALLAQRCLAHLRERCAGSRTKPTPTNSCANCSSARVSPLTESRKGPRRWRLPR